MLQQHLRTHKYSILLEEIKAQIEYRYQVVKLRAQDKTHMINERKQQEIIETTKLIWSTKPTSPSEYFKGDEFLEEFRLAPQGPSTTEAAEDDRDYQTELSKIKTKLRRSFDGTDRIERESL